MLYVEKKDTRAMPTNCVFKSIGVVLVSFFVNFRHILHCFLGFLLLSLEQVNTDWDFSYCSQGTAIYCKSFIPHNK